LVFDPVHFTAPPDLGDVSIAVDMSDDTFIYPDGVALDDPADVGAVPPTDTAPVDAGVDLVAQPTNPEDDVIVKAVDGLMTGAHDPDLGAANNFFFGGTGWDGRPVEVTNYDTAGDAIELDRFYYHDLGKVEYHDGTLSYDGAVIATFDGAPDISVADDVFIVF
jgi:hypothetical protein